MKGQICMVTGATAGIGKETAKELARRQATVVLVGRNQQKGAATRAEIVAATGNEDVHLLLADLSSQQDIHNLANEFKARFDRLNVLVNNAGVFLWDREESVDGLEMTFATNHLGYYLTTLLLWEQLMAGGPARVINVSSDAHLSAKLNFEDLQNKKNFSGFRVYAQSKLANVLFTYELNRRLNGAFVTVNALHPGFIASDFGRNNKGFVGFFMRNVSPFFARPISEGADTPIYLATSDDVAGRSGLYFAKRTEKRSSKESYNMQSAERLWAESERLTGVTLPAHLAQNGS